MTKHILVVDDHDDIRDLLGRYLTQHGYIVSLACDGTAMWQRLEQETIDLVILDIMMPGDDGLTLCRQLRDKKGPPVIMLTAMGEEADVVVGLEMGADDYVAKPFSPRTLLARVKAVLRRFEEAGERQNTPNDAAFWHFPGWTLDVHQYQLIREDGLVVPLSAAEFRLLKAFLMNARKVLNRDQLMDLTRGREALPFDRSIDNQISRLRKKIEKDVKNPTLIKTVWGGGYMFAELASCEC